MTHLEVENLASDYLEGQLDLARNAELEQHLQICAECQEVLADLRQVLGLCQAAEDLEPAPWLIHRILRATIGEPKPSWKEQLATFFRPLRQPRVAQVVAMVVFSLSIIINAFGMDIRRLSARDLNPRTWVHRAYRSGHLLVARAEKFYYDLRVVYEIESRVRQLQTQAPEATEISPEPAAPAGGTTQSLPPGGRQLARLVIQPPYRAIRAASTPDLSHPGRSTLP